MLDEAAWLGLGFQPVNPMSHEKADLFEDATASLDAATLKEASRILARERGRKGGKSRSRKKVAAARKSIQKAIRVNRQLNRKKKAA